MGSSKSDKAEDRSFIDIARREQIIACAIRAIAREGFARASFSSIAKEAGVSVGVITYHFVNREELFEKAVEHIFAEGSKFMVPKLQGQATAAGMLRSYIVSNIRFIADHPEEMAALGQIVLNYRDRDGAPHYDSGKLKPVNESLEHLLRWGQETGDFRKFDATIMALAIRSAIDASIPLFLDGKGTDVDSIAEELATTFGMATSYR